ncbi:hypothetical protein [Halomonas ramblicola]|uniref:hypothetical protein n=1 Tax=Halomonas ramblicola TaxID=747349 RepID=UPI0025B5F984|nr:hypothetical protein [Halomonas ramblicola]MDN3522087.1 hypothetical protein [Halomonas ramblicola]
MKQIYIHVGAGKTGTSALQEFFFINRHLLDEKGVWVPTIGAVESNRFIAHHDLAGGRDSAPIDPRLLWEKVRSESENKSCVLVSSEIFHSRLRGQWGKDLFLWIKSLFYDWRVVCIYYIRRQDQWNESAYEQWVKDGTLRNGTTVEEFSLSFAGNQVEEISNISEIFGKENVVVRPYQRKQMVSGSIFSDFLSHVGIKEEGFSYPEKNPNPRLSIDALEFKRMSNAVLQTKKEAQYLLRPLIEYSNAKHRSTSEIYRSYTLISRDVRKEILDRYSEDYSYIAKEYLGREDGNLFYEEEDKKHVSAYLELEEAVKITSFLFVNIIKRLEKIEKRVRLLECDD